ALAITFAQEGATGYVYVTGTFAGTLTFAGGISVTSRGGNDALILKLLADTGDVVWAKALGGTTTTADAGFAIAAGPAGTVLIAGQFAGTLGSASITGLPTPVS